MYMMKRVPIQKIGIDKPIRAKVEKMVSKRDPRLRPARKPIGRPIASDTKNPPRSSWRVAGIRSISSGVMSC